jgi:AcrR family transcriptional regulator
MPAAYFIDRRSVNDDRYAGAMGRKEQAAASRAALIEAGGACFAELGYEATTVAEVLDRVGMARGALYHYFPGGKRELFFAVFEAVNEGFHRRRDVAAALPTPLERIRAGVGIFLDVCAEDDIARILLIDAPAVVPGQAERGSTYLLLVDQLREMDGDYDAEVMAMALFSAVRSAGEHVMAATDPALARAEAGQVLDRLLDALEE